MKKIILSLFLFVISLSALAGIRGDMNNSGSVDVSDVNAVINIILNKNTIEDFPGNGDMDANGVIDVTDINHIINVILNVEDLIYDPEEPAIGVMAGLWLVTPKYVDENGITHDNPYGIDRVHLSTYATDNNDADKMWIYERNFWGLELLVPVNLNNHTFEVNNVPYDLYETGNVTLHGQVLPGAGHNIFGAPIDSIYFDAVFDDDSDGYTWRYAGVRYQKEVVINLKGDNPMTIPLGSSYVEPGFTATIGGVDVSYRVVVNSNVNVNAVGVYKFIYSATNDIGVETNAERTVIVYNPDANVNISGLYETNMDESEVYSHLGGVYDWYSFANMATAYGNTTQCIGITFEKVAPGIFYCNDLVGGFYWQIRGYGPNYAMTGYVKVDNSGNVTLLDSHVQGWGDGLDYIENAHYDFSTNTISYNLMYASAITMNIVMNKVAD